MLRVVAQLLSETPRVVSWVIAAAVGDRVPDEGGDTLRDQVRHELKLFAERQATGVAALNQLLRAVSNTVLLLGDLHVEVVRVERLEQRHDVQEDGQSVLVEHDLFLRDNKLAEDEVLVSDLIDVLVA